MDISDGAVDAEVERFCAVSEDGFSCSLSSLRFSSDICRGNFGGYQCFRSHFFHTQLSRKVGGTEQTEQILFVPNERIVFFYFAGKFSICGRHSYSWLALVFVEK